MNDDDVNPAPGVGRRAADPDEDPGMAALLRDARAGWNSPPDTPREAIWAGIEARLFAGDAPVGRAGGPPPDAPGDARRRAGAGDRRAQASGGPGWRPLAAAAAVVLLLGVGIGRITMAPPSASPTGGGSPPAAAAGTATPRPAGDPTAPVRFAAATHLTSAETLLALVRADARTGEVDPAVGRWGRRLLTETRLLLDSPAVRDPALRRLLEELEVVLAQVAVLSDPAVDDARRRSELELLARGLDEGGVRSRLRASLPALEEGLARTD